MAAVAQQRFSMDNTNFKETWLWRQAFVEPRSDSNKEEQEFFRQQYLLMRDKAAQLVSCISRDMPGLTVDDITHLDALWDIASLLAKEVFDFNPAEAFVFGAAILLHDAGLTIAAYPNGIDDLRKTALWKDILATIRASQDENEPPSPTEEDEIVPIVLRRLHAEKASELAGQPWFVRKDERIFLIEETEIRRFYGSSIGQIAHSHWWPLSRVETELDTPLGAFPPYTRCTVDRLKIGCLLRVADALHLDRRRAPLFRRALLKPSGISSDHWSFQEKLAAPQITGDAVVFTASEPFPLNEADSWWLAFDTIAAADRELAETSQLLKEKIGIQLPADRIKGASSPKLLSRTIPTLDWIPVETKVHVSDVPKIVEALGGRKLYGDDPLVAVRELIQNGRDAVEARRRRQNRPTKWGCVKVETFTRENQDWISVEDNGVGMSERILTGPLMDFGASLWNSPLLSEEFPGLAAAGMKSVGRFGIGFFSVFMLGQFVRVVTRPYDKGEDQARVLEFRSGLKSRPILYRAPPAEAPMDGGTRVEILLSPSHASKDSTANDRRKEKSAKLEDIVAALAPAVDVSIEVNGEVVIKALDWLRISPDKLCSRYVPFLRSYSEYGGRSFPVVKQLIRNIRNDNGDVIGRACIYPTSEYSLKAVATVGGLSAVPIVNMIGLVAGEPITVARDQAELFVAKGNWSEWATEQAELLKKERTDPRTQAEAAEIVLECGGDVRDLNIVEYGETWLSQHELFDRIKPLSRLRVHFGDLDHDDEDPVPASAFENDFVINDDLLVVPHHDGRIRTIKKKRSWDEYDLKRSPYRIGVLFRAILAKAWPGYEEHDDIETVGTVDHNYIERFVTTYTRRSE
jgi:hypothetical protein